MTAKQWKILFHIFMILGILISGFFIGRSTIKVKEITTIEYIKGDTIRDTLYYPKPYKEILPIDTLSIIKQCIKDGIYQELWPEKVITEYVEITKEDTSKIMKDWASKRLYNEKLFQNDSLGSCSVEAEVQYNRMRLIGYNYVPITKEITETKYLTKTFSPFVGAGYVTNPWDDVRNPIINLNGGIFIKEKYGIQLQLMHALKSKDDYIGGSILLKF
jgi:hypothetical protein